MTKLGDCKFQVSLMLKTKFINQELVLRIVSRDKEEIVSKRGKQFSPKFPLNTMTAINQSPNPTITFVNGAGNKNLHAKLEF